MAWARQYWSGSRLGPAADSHKPIHIEIARSVIKKPSVSVSCTLANSAAGGRVTLALTKPGAERPRKNYGPENEQYIARAQLNALTNEDTAESLQKALFQHQGSGSQPDA